MRIKRRDTSKKKLRIFHVCFGPVTMRIPFFENSNELTIPNRTRI